MAPRPKKRQLWQFANGIDRKSLAERADPLHVLLVLLLSFPFSFSG
jgi:hypothetical protein